MAYQMQPMDTKNPTTKLSPYSFAQEEVYNHMMFFLFGLLVVQEIFIFIFLIVLIV